MAKRRPKKPPVAWEQASATELFRRLPTVWPRRPCRLLMCGLLRLHWAELTDPREQAAVVCGEEQADSGGTVEAIQTAVHGVWALHRERSGSESVPAVGSRERLLLEACQLKTPSALSASYFHYYGSAATVMRELFPDPAGVPPAVAEDWRTATVRALAAGAYKSRDFSGLPVLADALEEAGCDHAGLLAHLRGPGPHVRGCWALDAVRDQASGAA